MPDDKKRQVRLEGRNFACTAVKWQPSLVLKDGSCPYLVATQNTSVLNDRYQSFFSIIMFKAYLRVIFLPSPSWPSLSAHTYEQRHFLSKSRAGSLWDTARLLVLRSYWRFNHLFHIPDWGLRPPFRSEPHPCICMDMYGWFGGQGLENLPSGDCEFTAECSHASNEDCNTTRQNKHMRPPSWYWPIASSGIVLGMWVNSAAWTEN